MSKSMSLFVCYVCRNSDLSSFTPVFCYAFSSSQAINMATRFCVDNFYWDLDTFNVLDPVLVTNFSF